MIALLFLFLNLLILPLKPTSRLEAENAALRHQLAVLQRKLRGRIEFTNGDRQFFLLLYRLFPSVLKAMTIVQPETVVRWHRAGFCCYWRWTSRRRGGRPPVSAELRASIRQMSVENVLWGAPRIQGELLKLGFTVAQSTVAKYMAKRDNPRGQSWGTFLRNHAPQIAAMDVRGSNHQLDPALRPGDCPTGTARACLDQCHKTPDSRLDRAADHRGLSVE